MKLILIKFIAGSSGIVGLGGLLWLGITVYNNKISQQAIEVFITEQKKLYDAAQTKIDATLTDIKQAQQHQLDESIRRNIEINDRLMRAQTNIQRANPTASTTVAPRIISDTIRELRNNTRPTNQ